jgi:hypothetical protein
VAEQNADSGRRRGWQDTRPEVGKAQGVARQKADSGRHMGCAGHKADSGREWQDKWLCREGAGTGRTGGRPSREGTESGRTQGRHGKAQRATEHKTYSGQESAGSGRT